MLSDIREHQEISSTPVIVCINNELKEKNDKCYSLGATDVLVKVKYTPGQLIKKIKEAAQKKK